MFGKKPDLSHLRPFGCMVTSRKLDSDDLTKFEARGEPGRFLGYARDSKGYLIWFPHRRSVLVRRDVIFHDVPNVVSPPRIDASDLLEMWEDVPQHNQTQFASRFFRDTRDFRPDTYGCVLPHYHTRSMLIFTAEMRLPYPTELLYSLTRQIMGACAPLNHTIPYLTIHS